MQATPAWTRLGVLFSSSLLTVLLLIGATGVWAAEPSGSKGRPQLPLPGDWPTYGHDPQRTSYNPVENSISPDNVGRLMEVWQAHIGINPQGIAAFSAPSVANGTVYVASSYTAGDNFFAFNAVTGSQLWSTSINADPTECFGVGIGSTPAISGTVVTIGGGDSAYYGINTLTGARLWRDAMDAGASAFAWSSPLLANNRCYLGIASDCDNPSVQGEARALNYSTGARLARQFIVPQGQAGGGVWNSPTLSPDGRRIIVATGEDYGGYDGIYNRALMVLDAATLAVITYDRRGVTNRDEDWATSPIVFHDSSGRNMVGAGHKDGVFYAYDLNNVGAGPVWSRAFGVDVGMLPAYDPTFGPGGTVFFTSDHALYAVDSTTGQDRWAPVTVGLSYGNMAIANGLIYLNSGGPLLIIDEATGTPIRTITPQNAGMGYSGPVVSNGTVYWVSGEYLNAYRYVPINQPTPVPNCVVDFSDVQPGSPFYAYVSCLVCRGVVGGYPDNTFRPNHNITRAQVAKIASLAAGLSRDPGEQMFADVPPAHTFFPYVQRLARIGITGGYPCGGPGEPCGPANLPYFRPTNGATRGQIAKLVSETAGLSSLPGDPLFEDVQPGTAFYTYTQRLANAGGIGGYPCGGPGEPCGPTNLPYFRPSNSATRGQVTKIVSSAFFPECVVR